MRAAIISETKNIHRGFEVPVIMALAALDIPTTVLLTNEKCSVTLQTQLPPNKDITPSKDLSDCLRKHDFAIIFAPFTEILSAWKGRITTKTFAWVDNLFLGMERQFEELDAICDDLTVLTPHEGLAKMLKGLLKNPVSVVSLGAPDYLHLLIASGCFNKNNWITICDVDTINCSPRQQIIESIRNEYPACGIAIFSSRIAERYNIHYLDTNTMRFEKDMHIWSHLPILAMSKIVLMEHPENLPYFYFPYRAYWEAIGANCWFIYLSDYSPSIPLHGAHPTKRRHLIETIRTLLSENKQPFNDENSLENFRKEKKLSAALEKIVMRGERE